MTDSCQAGARFWHHKSSRATDPHWNHSVLGRPRNVSPFLKIVVATLATSGESDLERLEALCCIHKKTLKARLDKVPVPKLAEASWNMSALPRNASSLGAMSPGKATSDPGKDTLERCIRFMFVRFGGIWIMRTRRLSGTPTRRGICSGSDGSYTITLLSKMCILTTGLIPLVHRSRLMVQPRRGTKSICRIEAQASSNIAGISRCLLGPHCRRSSDVCFRCWTQTGSRRKRVGNPYWFSAAKTPRVNRPACIHTYIHTYTHTHTYQTKDDNDHLSV